MRKNALTAKEKDRIFRCRKIREDAGLSQEQFANALGVSVSGYKKVESYEHKMSINILERLHQEMNVSANYILFGEQSTQEQAWASILNCPDMDKVFLLMRLCSYLSLNKESPFLINDVTLQYALSSMQQMEENN